MEIAQQIGIVALGICWLVGAVFVWFTTKGDPLGFRIFLMIFLIPIGWVMVARDIYLWLRKILQPYPIKLSQITQDEHWLHVLVVDYKVYNPKPVFVTGVKLNGTAAVISYKEVANPAKHGAIHLDVDEDDLDTIVLWGRFRLKRP